MVIINYNIVIARSPNVATKQSQVRRSLPEIASLPAVARNDISILWQTIVLDGACLP